jgi:brefeldin A-resistance guanine nucleotide exchange factor 1
MFTLLWGPTVAAVSVILDHAEDPVIIRQALDGLLLCARIASCHHVDEVALCGSLLFFHAH